MALLLNETDLIASVCDNVPVGMIELVLRGVGRDHFERLLNFVGERIGASAHVEFYLEWFLSFCKVSQHWSGFWWLQYLTQASVAGSRRGAREEQEQVPNGNEEPCETSVCEGEGSEGGQQHQLLHHRVFVEGAREEGRGGRGEGSNDHIKN